MFQNTNQTLSKEEIVWLLKFLGHHSDADEEEVLWHTKLEKKLKKIYKCAKDRKKGE